MKEKNIVQDKSYGFAVKIIKLYQYLVYEKKEFALSKQILRSGTSIGANIEEAIGGQSKRDFIAKLSISYKEARETHYWLRLLRDTGLIPKERSASLIKECDELLKLLGTIVKSSKKSMGNN